MKVMVCGTRSWRDVEAIEQKLNALPRENLQIVTGTGMRLAPTGQPIDPQVGADSIAYLWAHQHKVRRKCITPRWGQGDMAGIQRNRQLLDLNPDLVLAFWDGTSTGTRDAITEAKRRDIPVKITYDHPQPSAKEREHVLDVLP